MQIRKILALTGPNIWSNRPAIEAWVDIGHFEDFPSNTLPGFNDRLMRWLPTMVEHRCSVGERGGFFQRLRDGTWLGHVLEHVTLELQSLAHLPVGFGRARETSERGVYKVVVRCEEPKFAVECLHSARSLILAAVDDKDFDVSAEVQRLHEFAYRTCLGPSTQAIVSAARERGIPALRLTEANLVQLGYGRAQRRIWTAETSKTSAVAESIAQDKDLTRRLLSAVGVPVPAGRVVSSASDAWDAAVALGLPVVVKPQDGNHGRGVSIRLEEQSAVEAGFVIANREGLAARDGRGSGSVLVERFIRGTQYRVLVVGDRAVAASGGEAEKLIGDGVRTIEELVNDANRDPKRGTGTSRQLSMLVLDDISLELLRRQGLEPKSVPSTGQTVVIHYNGDLTVDVTDRMHPDVAMNCVLAAQTVGLDIAGIDLIAEDIGRPLDRQGGAVIEVNASPGLIMHLRPLIGRPQPVGEAIVNHLFSEKETGRVPLIAVSGTNGKTPVAALIGSMFGAAGRSVGQVDSMGLRVAGRAITRTNAVDAESGKRLLMNPFADALVFEVDEGSVLDSGLAFDRCDVAVITNLGHGDHLGKQYVEHLLTVSKAVRAPLDTVPHEGFGVLNADDPGVVEMAQHCKGKLIYFGRSPNQPTLAAHVATGGVAVSVEGGGIVAFRDNQCEYLLQLDRLSCAVLGLPDMFLENLLAAVAAGLAVGLKPNVIRAGVERALGRENNMIFEGSERVAIASPARNLSALTAWVQTLRQAFPDHRYHAIIEQSRDWRAADVEAIRTLITESFVTFSVITEGDCPPDADALLSPPTRPDSPTGRRFQTMTDAISDRIEALGPSELLFVQAASTASHTLALHCLADKGMSPRRTSGIVSVEHCR